jgi:hypothetical protein
LASKLREGNVTPLVDFGVRKRRSGHPFHQLSVKKEGKVTQTSISGFYM